MNKTDELSLHCSFCCEKRSGGFQIVIIQASFRPYKILAGVLWRSVEHIKTGQNRADCCVKPPCEPF